MRSADGFKATLCDLLEPSVKLWVDENESVGTSMLGGELLSS